MRTDREKAADQERISREYQTSVDRRRQGRDGVVVTPVEVVDFQIRSAIEAISLKGRAPDQGVEWLDPFGGTGIFTARLIQIVDLPPNRKRLLAENCVVIELDHDAAQVCANNLSAVVLEETGQSGLIRVICTDTFALDPEADLWYPSLPVVLPSWMNRGAA
ncbi:hypothetical protein [Paenirhodobacter populi]|uniref:DNA methylase adenine-specific domain-containing protein n=1 Tax=Paenirhodobacter populi TaxID=2306993 RepID=A0A443J7C9_9RHOB|nr:hypothetical protein [Sinirhodobacter populi]RWR16420.1 hypothetical protein D2T30_21755 [Sinirhodobacter populi]